MQPGRRRVLKCLSLAALGSPLAGCTGAAPRVVVIGGGFGGATVAKYLRRVDPRVHVTLVEASASYFTCPFSNTVLAGLRPLAELERDPGALAERHGISLVKDRASAVNPDTRLVRLAGGGDLRFDRLVVAPGVALRWGRPEGYDPEAARTLPHAWKAGEQTTLLRRQLEAMPDGGVVAITVPKAPFRCPPGPYERASLIAGYLKRAKPRSKVLILDANEGFSKQSLFEAAWAERYPGVIERVPISEDGAVRRVDAGTRTLYTELERHRVDVANVIPAQHAGRIAHETDLADASGWCPVDQATFESTRVPGVHVLGDAALAGAMPKSASAANSQAKNCALALAALLRGEAPPPEPSFHNTCYSLVAEDYGISVSMIYRLQGGTIEGVEGAGGVSPAGARPEFRAKEAEFARGWYDSITADSFS